MKWWISFVCALSIIARISVFALADDGLTGEHITYEDDPSVEASEMVEEDADDPGDDAASDASDNSGQTPIILMTSADSSDASSDPVSVYDLDDADAPASGTLPALASSVFGSYSPRTQTVTTYLSDGTSVSSTQIVPGVAGLDWYWISGVGCFALVLISFFRLLGVVFKHG